MSKNSDTKQRVLDTAMGVAEAKSLYKPSDFSMYSVTRAMGMSPATGFYYFGSLEGLRKAVIDEAVRVNNETIIRQAVAMGDLEA